ncbi:MAG TPA: hypothetical protein VKB36_08045, partial [Vicinamibacterales bacterium]|nr:hypothetical protein [Vicinamibacterales bacterium]
MASKSSRSIHLMLAGALAVASLSTAVLAGQSQPAAPKRAEPAKAAYKTPRTPWGDPDFQGN